MTTIRNGIRLLASILVIGLAACGGGGGGDGGDRPPPGPGPGQPPPPPPPPVDPLVQQIAAARETILADVCFRNGGGCAFTDHAYRPADFAMTESTGEAILIVDTFDTLPVRALRYRNRIKGFYRFGAGGVVVRASSTWHVPTSLWRALASFSGPDHVAAWRLRSLRTAIQTAYPGVAFDNVGHGSMVFSLLADANPRQPLILMDGFSLHEMAPDAYCDVSGSATAQHRLAVVAQQAAVALQAMIQAEEVRFINYSGGHTLQTIRADWTEDCGGPPPSDDLLRSRLAAHELLYAVLFATPGVATAHAAIGGGQPIDFPFDQASSAYANRIRVGYFTSLASGLDAQGRGAVSALGGWPSEGWADLYVNTGVLPTRPFQHNRTPLLQIDDFGVDHFPIKGPQSSWVTPLALSRLIHLRQSIFADRPMDDALVADLFERVTPGACPSQTGGRCRYQDPLLHGQIEAIRLGYQPLEY